MGKGDSANHRKARAFINAKVKARSMAHPNTLPCVVCGHVWVKGERRHEYDHTHDYEDATTWGLVEAVCTKCHHERTEKRGGVQATAELSTAERVIGTPFPPGVSGNPGGQSKEKRDFLERLREEDADKAYEAMMDLIKLRNPQAVLRVWEYIVGKPKELLEVTGKNGAPLLVVRPEATVAERMQTLAVLIKSGAFEQLEAKTETADPVENTEQA